MAQKEDETPGGGQQTESMGMTKEGGAREEPGKRQDDDDLHQVCGHSPHTNMVVYSYLVFLFLLDLFMKILFL